MKRWSRVQLADHQVVRSFTDRLAALCVSAADFLADLAELDFRKLYLPEGFSSMHRFCVDRHGMSDAVTDKCIRVARAGREFPALFDALAANRLNLSGALLLAPKLSAANAAELIVASTRMSNEGIERLLAERFPRADVPTLVMAVGPAPDVQSASESLAVRRVILTEAGQAAVVAPAPTPAPPAYARVTPLAPQRYSIQVTVSESTREKLRRAQELLGHAVPNGDVAEVLDRALDALITQLEKHKFAKTDSPAKHRGVAKGRSIPADVKRIVGQRDGGQCTFVSDSGHRCASRKRLEYDHITPVAKGGESTAANLRLRCRAHNQYAAEQAFGKRFMDGKRERAKAHAPTKPERVPLPPSTRLAPAATDAQVAAALEVVPWLRHLGPRADEARGVAVKKLILVAPQNGRP